MKNCQTAGPLKLDDAGVVSPQPLIDDTNNKRHADSPEVGWAVPTNPMLAIPLQFPRRNWPPLPREPVVARGLIEGTISRLLLDIIGWLFTKAPEGGLIKTRGTSPPILPAYRNPLDREVPSGKLNSLLKMRELGWVRDFSSESLQN